MKTPLEKVPLLQQFVNGDDAFRNSRFKLIPYISKVCMYVKKIKTVPLTLCNLLTMPIPCFFYKGSWIVKQSVGKKACLIGQQLEMNYYRGNNYLEVKLICLIAYRTYSFLYMFRKNFQLCVNIGSSTVAKGVVSLVLGYLNNLVIEMAFLIQVQSKYYFFHHNKLSRLILSELKPKLYLILFSFQANTAEELPEFLLGTCRLNHLDTSKSVAIGSIPS